MGEKNSQISKYNYYDYDLKDKLNLPTVIKYLTARLYPGSRIGKGNAVISTNSSDAQLSNLQVKFIRFQVFMAVGTRVRSNW